MVGSVSLVPAGAPTQIVARLNAVIGKAVIGKVQNRSALQLQADTTRAALADPARPAMHLLADVPYVIAIVELDEGPHLMTRLIAVENKSIHVGQRATVEFEDLDEEISLPRFKIDQP